MQEVMVAEVVGLIKHGTFALVLLPDEHGENVIPSRLVLAIKHATIGDARCKARFVIGGHRGRENNRMVHTPSTLSHSSVLLVLSLAAVLRFDV